MIKSHNIVLEFVPLRRDIKLDIGEVCLVLWIGLRIGKIKDILEVNMNIGIEETTETITPMPKSGVQDLFSLAQALSLAVDRGFMKREHAGAIWKRVLKRSGIDDTRKEGGD